MIPLPSIVSPPGREKIRITLSLEGKGEGDIEANLHRKPDYWKDRI
jgi:hypothetical protein